MFSKIEIDERDRRVVDLVIKENYNTIKDLYHYVQGRSLNYPIVDSDEVYKHLFSKLNLSEDGPYSSSNFKQLMSQTEFKRY